MRSALVVLAFLAAPALATEVAGVKVDDRDRVEANDLVLNGEPRGKIIVGGDFYRALLRIWLGDEPAQDSLKKALLGGG